MMQLLTPAVRAHYSCRLCGATSYRNIFDRNGAGAIRATSMYRCSGCTLTFQNLKEWRIAPNPI
ncbi:MAG: hypothetical protein WA210_05165, partial [Burkholderiaceae bacterium]